MKCARVEFDGNHVRITDTVTGEYLASFNAIDHEIQAADWLRANGYEGYHEPMMYGIIKLPIARRI